MTASDDVIVAGAGPAGVATAVALVRQQGFDPRRIRVFDKAAFPRAKPCGGGLTGHATAAMDALGLALRVPSTRCQVGAVVYGRLRKEITLDQPVHVVRREEFDADLVAQARAIGIAIQEGEGVQDFAPVGARGQSGLQVLTTAGRTIAARILVGADGAGSKIRRRLHAGQGQRSRQPLRLAQLEVEAPRDFGETMIYDFSAFTEGLRGYVWLFLAPGRRLNVGIMHYPSSDLGGRELDRILARALAPFGVPLPAPARGWPAWPYSPSSPVSDGPVLLVGDAAGIDALTGEGIAVGLCHGAVAAAQIGRAFAEGNFQLRGYAHALRAATVGRELTLDAHLARLLYEQGDFRRDFRRMLGLVMMDDRMLELYAARVCGSLVLADQRLPLLRAAARHLIFGAARARRLRAYE